MAYIEDNGTRTHSCPELLQRSFAACQSLTVSYNSIHWGGGDATGMVLPRDRNITPIAPVGGPRIPATQNKAQKAVLFSKCYMVSILYSAPTTLTGHLHRFVRSFQHMSKPTSPHHVLAVITMHVCYNLYRLVDCSPCGVSASKECWQC